jgi:hypothetical protein
MIPRVMHSAVRIMHSRLVHSLFEVSLGVASTITESKTAKSDTSRHRSYYELRTLQIVLAITIMLSS